MNYPDLTKELTDIFTNETPSGLFTDRIKADIIYSMRNLSQDEALAFCTCLLNAAQGARNLAATYFIESLDFDRQSGQKYNDGRNFTTFNNLVFRINTKVDYNYQQNDDLEPEYGLNFAELNIRSEINAQEAKLITKQLDLRKRLIRSRHPRMMPIPGSVKHSASYLGTWIEASQQAQLSTT